MKKNLKIFLIGTVASATMILPFTSIAIYSSNKEGSKTKSLSDIEAKSMTEPQNSRTPFDQTSDIFTDPVKFSELNNARVKSASEDEWTPVYNFTDWSKLIDIEVSFYRAREDGWRSMEDYERYLRAHYETNNGEVERTFGEYITHDWIAWHHSAGGALWESYNDGDLSNVRPTWQEVELQPENKIDNTIPWYLYDRGNKIFAFDDNNLENAFKRLKYMKRLESTNAESIRNESGKDKNNTNVTRNKYLINGEFRELDPSVEYFYVKDSEIDYVRDANGWKVIVAPQLFAGATMAEKLSNMYTTVLNPHPQGTTATKAGDVAVSPDQSEKYGIATTEVAGYAEETNPIEKQKLLDAARKKDIILKEEFKELVYPANYNVNADFALANVNDQSPDKNGKSLHDSSITWSGLYKIVRKSANFRNMADDPNTLLPQEYYFWNHASDQYGRKQTRIFIGGVGCGGYNYLWIEDGHGGRKVWKNLRTLTEVRKERPVGDPSKRGYHGKGFEDVVRHESSNHEVKFYGNFKHIFPGTDDGKKWFQGLSDEWERVGN